MRQGRASRAGRRRRAVDAGCGAKEPLRGRFRIARVPSGFLRFVRFWLRSTVVAALACAAIAAPASAARVLVLHTGGKLTQRADPGVAAFGARTHPPVRAGTSAKRKTVVGELKRLREAGVLDDGTYLDRRADYEDAKRFAKRLPRGRRKIEMTSVVGLLDSLAGRGLLTASRIEPLWLTLDRNREWWSKGPLLA